MNKNVRSVFRMLTHSDLCILLFCVAQSMATINPAQVALLKEMQPEFNFQERKVLPELGPAAKGAGDSLLDNDTLGDESNVDGGSLGGFSDKSMTDILGLNGRKIIVLLPLFALSVCVN